MKQSSKTLRKMLAVALAVATIGSAGIMTEAGSFVGTEITANAANYELHTYNNITYALYSDGTAEAVSYSGTNKDFSTSSFTVPSVIYSKNLGQDYILSKSQFTVTKMQADGFSGIKARIFGLPNSLQVLFGGFKNTEIGTFSISTNNSYFTVVNGMLCNKSKTEIIAYPSKPSLYYTGSDFVSIPNTVTSVGMYAFTSYKATSLTIPSTVTYVGRSAFQYSNLYSVTFEGSPDFWCANSDEIGTFDDAANLDSITIKGTSGKYATYNGAVYNKGLTVLMCCPKGRTTSSAFAISATATKIGSYAFRNCKKLTAIHIPETITSIGDYEVFYNTNKDLVLYVTQDSYGHTYAKNKNMAYKVIYPYTKKSDNTLKITGYDGPWNSFSIPSKINGYTVSEIGAEAFKGKTNITSVSIPSTVTAIGENAFSGCTKLSSISLPSTVTSIGQKAFYNTAATSITIPSSMTAIGDYTFYGMSKLESISIPSKVTKIGSYAFGHCKALTSVTIPNNVTSIGFGAFYNCTKLSSLTIGSGVTSIGGTSFCNTALTSQYIPKTVTSIGSYAFGYKYADSTYTRDSAFTEISGYPNTAAQTYCKNYNVPFKSLLQYSTSSDGKSIKIEKYTGTDTVVVIPDKIDGLPVTSIASYAFNGTNVTKVTLPSGMTALDGYAFYGASNLTTVNLPSTITFIGAYAFYGTGVTKITLPSSMTSIGENTFSGASNLTTVNLPSTITSIGAYAFNNTSITSITLPANMTALNGYALYGASKLTTVVFPSGLTSIGEDAFEFCTSLKSITIPNTVTSIGNGAFYACNQLASVNLGTGVKTIGDYAFENTALTSVTIPKSVIYIGNYAFGDTWANNTHTMVDGFQITGYAYTAAETYANKYSITFNPLYESITNTSTISKTAITLGQSITINFSSTGGKRPMTYAAMYSLDGGSSVSICSYSENTSATFTPTSAGTYAIYTYAKDDRGQFIRKDFTLTVETPAVKNTSTLWIGENQGATTMYADDSVGIAAGATGGNGEYKYSVFYHLRGSNTWYTAIEDTTKTNISFRMTDDNGESLTGDCQILVTAKDTDGKFESRTFNMTVYERLANTSTISAETVKVGDSITINAGATGGTGNYKYHFSYTSSSLDDWGGLPETSEGVCTFVPDYAGRYQFAVIVYDMVGSTIKESATKIFDVTVEEAQQKLINESTISSETAAVGAKVTFTGKASGGTGGYQYAFLYKKASENKWVNKQSFAANDTVSIKPEAAVDYDVCIKVKDSSGTVEKKYFTLHVNEALESASTISSLNIGKGQTVTVSAAGKNGVGPYTYSVLYKQKSKTKWTTKQDFSQNSQIEVKPASTGLYDVCVKVKDSLGTIAKTYFEVNVAAAVTSNSTISATEIKKGESVTVKAAAKGGIAPYTYSVQYKQQSKSKWTTQQDFAANDTIKVTPASTTTYDICVKVQDGNGTIGKQYFTVTVK